MLGPVISRIWRVAGSASRSLGTNSPARIPASSTGWRAARDFGERHDRVEFAYGACGFKNCCRVRLQIAQQLGEDLQFELLERGFRRQDFALELLERGRGEALGTDQRLLALVVGRHALEIGLGDF